MNQETLWARATIGAAVVIVALLIFQFLVPVPKPKGDAQYFQQEKVISTERLVSEKKADQFKEANVLRLWNLGPEALGPMAMGKVSNMAKATGLSMVAFRPQRTISAGDLVRYGYQISLEGSFAKVIEFARKLETPETKLAVVSLQVTSTDGASDAVNATVGVVAYREREAGVKPITSAKKETAASLASENKEK